MLAQDVPEEYREGTGLQAELANVTAAWEDYDRRERAYAEHRRMPSGKPTASPHKSRKNENGASKTGRNTATIGLVLQRTEQAGIADLAGTARSVGTDRRTGAAESGGGTGNAWL